ncbi:MAG TPA: glucose dehydrogenase, partial [Chloroflexota bacterium]|nr:glucose dehydrogenase [Chloroflexota bacterium]
PDNEEWARRHPHLHDIPGRDVTLAGRNFETPDFLYGRDGAQTGPFKQFGTQCTDGEVVKGATPATAAIARADSEDGGGFEVIAWGLRDVTCMAAHQDGRIYCADIGMAEWGSRPVADNHERIWQVLEAGWYGWPDFAGGVPVTDARFKPRNDPQPEFLLRDHPMDNLVRDPVATLPPGSGLSKMEFSRSRMVADENTAFLALGGDFMGISDHGFRVMTLDVNSGELNDFAVNKEPGPSSVTRSGGFEHPVDVRFDRTGEVMHIVDLGIVEMTPQGPAVVPGTGVLWRISWTA